MLTPARGSLRVTRVAAFSLPATSLALAAHVVGGGAVPGVGWVAGGAALCGMAATWLTMGRRGAVSIAVALCALQVCLHEMFMIGTAAMCGPAQVMSGHSMAMSAPAIGATLCHSGHAAPGWMAAAHAVATMATALVLARGEQALWGLCGWLRPLPRVDVASATATRRPKVLPAVGVLIVLAGLPVPARRPRRGPPSR